LHEDELRRQTNLCLGRVLGIAALGGNPATVHAVERRLRSLRDADRRGALDLLQEVARGEQRRRLVALVETLLSGPKAAPPPEAEAAVVAADPWLARVLSGQLEAAEAHLLALRRTLLFDEVPGEALALLAAAVVEESVAAGTVVVQQGEAGHALFVVLDGSLEMERDGWHVGRLSAGGWFGELALIDGAPRTATVTTTTATRLLRLERLAFQQALDRNPEIGHGLLLSLTRWLREGGRAQRVTPAAGVKPAREAP
jgi:hypothetical protein